VLARNGKLLDGWNSTMKLAFGKGVQPLKYAQVMPGFSFNRFHIRGVSFSLSDIIS
jgi:hypothetical protein